MTLCFLQWSRSLQLQRKAAKLYLQVQTDQETVSPFFCGITYCAFDRRRFPATCASSWVGLCQLLGYSCLISKVYEPQTYVVVVVVVLFQNLESQTSNLKLQTSDPTPKISSLKHKISNPKLQTQLEDFARFGTKANFPENIEPKAQNTKHKTLNLKPKISNFRVMTQGQGHDLRP